MDRGRNVVRAMLGFFVMLILGVALPGNATGATVTVTEPFESIDPVVQAITSDTPAFEWSASGPIGRFELQLSDHADFSSYWFRAASGTTYQVGYVSGEWTRFNTSANPPARLVDRARYYVRVKAFDVSNNLLAQSRSVPFTARTLVSGSYCNPDFDAVNASNANAHRTRGLHVVSNSRIDRSIRFRVIPSGAGIQSQVFDSAGFLLCTLNGGPMLRSREGSPSKGTNAMMRMSFRLRTDGYFNRISGAGPHIPLVLLGDMASLPSAAGGNAASEGIGAGFGNVSNWTDAGRCVKPRLASTGDTTGNLGFVESFRNSQTCVMGNDSTNHQVLTDQTYNVEIRAAPRLLGIATIRNVVSYKVTTESGALVAESNNVVDDVAPATRMHGGWLIFSVIGGQTTLAPFEIWIEDLKVDYMPTVDGGGVPIGNDLLAAFGSPVGLMVKKNNRDWEALGIQSPMRMANGDVDADGVSDVLMDFGTQGGLKLWKNGGAWQNVLSLSAQDIIATDLDADGKTDFVVSFGAPLGVFAYMSNGRWRQILARDVRHVVSGNLDGDPRRDLTIDVGPDYGIWMYMNNSEWVQLHGTSAEDLVVGDLDGNGIDDIVVDFGPLYGIWLFMNRASWVQLHGFSSQRMTLGNLDADPRKDVAIDFGPPYGIWVWKNNTSWFHLHGASSSMLGIADLDKTGIDDLLVDFGPPYGLWAWIDGATWVQQHGVSPQRVIGVDADRN